MGMIYCVCQDAGVSAADLSSGRRVPRAPQLSERSGTSQSDAARRVRCPADHVQRPGGETTENHRGQSGAGDALDGRESTGGQQTQR